jgi:plasmid stability protein
MKLAATTMVVYYNHMASITLKNIPEPLHCAFKRRAKAHSRSLQAEILRTLANSVDASEDNSGSLAVKDVVGMLKPRGKGLSIREMGEAIDRSFHTSWK